MRNQCIATSIWWLINELVKYLHGSIFHNANDNHTHTDRERDKTKAIANLCHFQINQLFRSISFSNTLRIWQHTGFSLFLYGKIAE